MEPLYNSVCLIRLLKKGLQTPNPSNPDIPMWALEDLDKPSSGWQDVVDTCNSNLAYYPRGYQGIRHKNLARKNTPVGEKVEVIDPKDLIT